MDKIVEYALTTIFGIWFVNLWSSSLLGVDLIEIVKNWISKHKRKD